MALKDASGRITIDEHAANQDVQKLTRAMAELNESKRALENIIRQAGSEQGQTARAVEEKAMELKRQVVALNDKLNETRQFIQHTVAHYQEVDRLLKEAIQNSAVTSAPAKQSASSSKPTSTSKSSSKPASTSSSSSKPKTSSSKKEKSKPTAKDVVEDIFDDIGDWFKSFGK